MQQKRTPARERRSPEHAVRGETQTAPNDRAANKAERDRLVARIKRLLADPGSVGLSHTEFVKLMADRPVRVGEGTGWPR